MKGKRKPDCSCVIEDRGFTDSDSWDWAIQTPTTEMTGVQYYARRQDAIRAVRHEAKRFAADYRIVENFEDV